MMENMNLYLSMINYLLNSHFVPIKRLSQKKIHWHKTDYTHRQRSVQLRSQFLRALRHYDLPAHHRLTRLVFQNCYHDTANMLVQSHTNLATTIWTVTNSQLTCVSWWFTEQILLPRPHSTHLYICTHAALRRNYALKCCIISLEVFR